MVEAPWQPLPRITLRRLAGEGGELDLAVGMVGEMLGERRLAGAGITEQAEHLRCAIGAGPGLEPVADGFQRVILGGENSGMEKMHSA